MFRIFFGSAFLLLMPVVSSADGEPKAKIWNVVNFSKIDSFVASPRIVRIDLQGVEESLDGYRYFNVSEERAKENVRIASKKLIEESLGLTDSDRSEKVRGILFGLEKYCFQVFGFKNEKHEIITMIAYKLGGDLIGEEVKSSLVEVDGGGNLYFRVQIEYQHDVAKSIRVILNQDF